MTGGKVAGALGIGEKNAIHKEVLARRLGLNERALRAQVHREQLDGARIVATESGYFLAADDSDIKRFISRTAKRGKSTFDVVRAMARHLGGDGGQMTLDEYFG